MVLAVHLPPSQAERAADAISQGADTIITGPFVQGRKAQEMARYVKGANNNPCGVWLGSGTPAQISSAKKAGMDYVVLSLDAPATALLGEEIGYVLALEGEVPDTMLRSLDGLPFDALLITMEAGPPTLRRQLEIRRLAGLSRLPLFLRMANEPTAEELKSLRDSGVIAVVVDGDQQESWAALPNLRQAIDGLPPRRRRRQERLEAMLPLKQSPGLAEEEEEEEEFE